MGYSTHIQVNQLEEADLLTFGYIYEYFKSLSICMCEWQGANSLCELVGIPGNNAVAVGVLAELVLH